jgi:hypothetical protein
MTTTINHKTRLELELSCNEYVFLDYIYQSKKKSFTIKDFYNNIGFTEEEIGYTFRSLKRFFEWDKQIIQTNNDWNRHFKKKKRFTPPTEKEVVDYFKEKGYKQIAGKKAFEYYNEADWEDSSGKKIRNWKQKMIGVWFKEENKESTNKTAAGTAASIPQKPIDI